MWAKDSIQEQVCGLGIAVVSEYVCVCVCVFMRAH